MWKKAEKLVAMKKKGQEFWDILTRDRKEN